MDIDQLLWELRICPDRYLADTTLARLVAFLLGFALAQKEQGIVEGAELLASFDAWVRAGYRETKSCGAESIIRFHSSGETDAVATFWRLLDEFLRQRHPKSMLGFPEVMRELRIRLGCYVGPRTLGGLLSFIRGFIHSQTRHGIAEGSDRFRAFETWIGLRFGKADGRDIESIIWLDALEELAAIDRFWQLWDDFTETQGQPGV